MLKTKVSLLKYRQAYQSLYGKEPDISINRGWVYIDGAMTAIRPTKLNEITQRMISKIESTKTESTKTESTKNSFGWKNYITKDIIVLFLDKLYNECGNSPFDLERYMKDYICNENIPDERVDDLQEELYNLENKYDNLENKYDNLLSKYDILEQELFGVKKQNHSQNASIEYYQYTIEKKNKIISELKKNSIIFSMNDMDDDIPFPF